MKCISDWAEKNKISTPTNSRGNQIITTDLFFPLKNGNFTILFTSCLLQIFMILFRKHWRSLAGLGTESLSMFSEVIHYMNFFTNLLYQQVSPLIPSLWRIKRKMKLTFRWNITCADLPPFCPLLTSSRCPSSKFKRISRPRRSFRITQMTLEV